ncbi:LysR family transcriptional regulator [Ostreiculturibacter nitratireducens]|uniref:LysR family transcriptional regulator n=1 Tax=Ostreiculturibacter nitratireducens TaxID=3075226 RepID=UPI003CCC5C11
MTALRAFVTVAEAGGVTRAAGLLNLTQSAVSMQIKRLEEGLGRAFFTRAARRLALTPEGEQLLGYARRMLELNDEALSRLTDDAYEGEIRLGVPHDIVYPYIPRILKRLAADYPRLRVNLVSSFSIPLKEGFAHGDFDMILTTEATPGTGGEVIARRELVWIGAPDGTAWQRRPLRLGFIEDCYFRPIARAALDAAGIPWEMAVDGKSEQVVEASVAADLAVSARLRGGVPEGTAAIEPGNVLPQLGSLAICLYRAPGGLGGAPAEALLSQLRAAYSGAD